MGAQCCTNSQAGQTKLAQGMRPIRDKPSTLRRHTDPVAQEEEEARYKTPERKSHQVYYDETPVEDPPQWQLYDYTQEPLYKIFMAQGPELGCLKRNQIKKALIQAEVEVEDVVSAYDEMDRNNDNLITYEEFRYYVGVVKKQK